MKFIAMMIVIGAGLISAGAHAESMKCEKAGSYAPAGDDTYSVKCNGVVVKGAEILPKDVADQLIREKEKDYYSDTNSKEREDFAREREELRRQNIWIRSSGSQYYPDEESGQPDGTATRELVDYEKSLVQPPISY